MDFLGLALNFSDEQVVNFETCLALFHLGRTVRHSLCLRLLRLMASAIFVVAFT